MGTPSHPPGILPRKLLSRGPHERPLRVSPELVASAAADAADVYARMKSRPEGLTPAEVEARLATHGPNVLAKDHPPSLLRLFGRALRNPLVVLLAGLAAVSFATGDPRAATMMLAMIALSVGLRLFQEAKANGAAAKLKAMISVKATAIRGGASAEVAVSQLVPGDVVRLTAGDMIPGDVRIVQAKDLFVVQGSLTGESVPVEKFAAEHGAAPSRTSAPASAAEAPPRWSSRRAATPTSEAWPSRCRSRSPRRPSTAASSASRCSCWGSWP